MATTNTNFISALGTGSGVDIKTLAQSLVDAEKVPKQKIIQERIDKTELRISGYSTVSFALDQLKGALEALKMPASFQSVTAVSSQPAVVGLSATGAVTTGSHEIEVSTLARAQRSVSAGFSSLTDSVRTDQPLMDAVDIRITLNGAELPLVSVNTPTLESVADAINDADLGVKASIANTGEQPSPYKLILQGPVGAAGEFGLEVLEPATGDAVETGLGLVFPPAQDSDTDHIASDAEFRVDGIRYFRSSNRIGDVVEGATLTLLGKTASPATVSTSRDVAPVKDMIKQIVVAYNDLDAILDAAESRDSKVEKLGGALVGDSTARRIRDQVRSILLPDVDTVGNSTTDTLTDLRQLGLFVDTDGKMKFSSIVEGASSYSTMVQVGSEATLDRVLADRYEDLTNMFSGSSGLAKDMADRISGSGSYFDTTNAPSSPIKLLAAQSRNATQRVAVDQGRLLELEDRMKALLERYLKQFSVMESLVGESKSLRSSVENSFKAMSNVR